MVLSFAASMRPVPRLAWLVVLLAAMLSVGLFEATPHTGFPLFALLAALLPLQLAALLFTVVARQPARLRPPASG